MYTGIQAFQSEFLPKCSWTSFRGHENGFRDVIKDLEQELGVRTSLRGRLDLVWIQLTRLTRFDDAETLNLNKSGPPHKIVDILDTLIKLRKLDPSFHGHMG